MGIFDQELILPGSVTEIVSDYSYGYDTSKFGTTDSVTLIGTAFNGPVGKPVAVYSPEHAKYIFGEVFNAKTRKKATLVAEIQDAWDRGCRTIYAVRVSGKDIFKDFQLALDTKLKIRVSGIFPSNANKDVYMVFDDKEGAMAIKVYKPSKRATIQEKVEGLVESEDAILVTTIDLSGKYNLTKDSRLSDLIKVVNEASGNNVMRLSIVNEDGNDVTISSKEAQGLAVGAMFPGAYLIGRDKNIAVATTDLVFEFADASNKPYSSFDGVIFKKLMLNTDVNEDLPIHGSLSALNARFAAASAVMVEKFDLLTVPGKLDAIYGKDAEDYEEVNISGFELYKKLGSGFAVTATAELTQSGDIRIKETPANDLANRIAPINDGIYSMLENLKSDYRVLTVGAADEAITGRLPKKADFKKMSAIEHSVFGGKIAAKPRIDAKDFVQPKKYSFKFEATASPDFGDPEIIKTGLYTEQTIKRVANIASVEEIAGMVFKPGTLFMVGNKLHKFDKELKAQEDAIVNADLKGKLFMVGDKVVVGSDATGSIVFEEITPSFLTGKTHVLVESGDAVYVYIITDGGVETATFTPVGSVEEVFSNDDLDKILMVAQTEAVVDNTILVSIYESLLETTTLEELVEAMNADSNLSKLFEFKVADEAALVKTDLLADMLDSMGVSAVKADRSEIFDTSMHIPYKTPDNFARQLAQHCTYTGLKTAPTHGVIGCSRLMDVNLSTVAKKVEQLAALDLNLVAKRSNGRDMLDRNNQSYPIGRTISVVVGQYAIADGAGYNYLSNAAAGYAGMVSALPLDQSSTNQPINIPAPMYELTNYQLERLTLKGYVTFKQSYTRGFVVTDGVTMAPSLSPFRRLSVARIINAVEEVIRSATEPFIGKQNHLSNRNSMQTAVKSELEKLKGRLIEGYEFKLVVDPAALKLGIVDIDYSIVPIYEIREVRNRITVKESL